MKYRLAIFDFDGTLADSFGFCVGLVNTLADKHGFRKIEDEEIESLRHLHAREIMRQLDLSMWRLPLITADFISRMKRNADQIKLFPGVAETLAFLKQQGVTLAIMSSNSRENFRRSWVPRSWVSLILLIAGCHSSARGSGSPDCCEGPRSPDQRRFTSAIK